MVSTASVRNTTAVKPCNTPSVLKTRYAMYIAPIMKTVIIRYVSIMNTIVCTFVCFDVTYYAHII